MRHHLTRLLLATGVLAVTAPLLALAASAASGSTPERTPAAVAVTALLNEPAPVAARAVPAGFESVMGYRPQIRGGRLVDPDGGCSGPIPLPAEFSLACAEHDLGYDLLRYADLTDEQVGGWARSGIDERLDERMRAACTRRLAGADQAVCTAAAQTATAGVELNSVRQFQLGPEESAGSLAVTGVAGAAGTGAVGAVLLAVRGRVRGGRTPRFLASRQGVSA